MKVSMSWLKDFVDIDVPVQELADRLVSAGFEVEEIIDKSAEIRNVVLGKIVKMTHHPDADKLWICSVDIGEEAPVQIVTGAQNLTEGDLVPAALDDSYLPGGKHIKTGKLRGVDSCGMLCSGEELGLTESDYKGAGVYGILVMNKETAPLGTDINEVLGNDDIILDIGVTANRSDCNSVLGIAREVSAVLGKPLRMPKIGFKCCDDKVEDKISVKVEIPELCPRYMAASVADVKIVPSDDAIAKRLRSVGLRPINSIVDITNYVLIEIGQPMHAFDAHKLDGGKIVVRTANEGEKIVALDNKEYTLDPTMVAICDESKPCAIGGVMGGNNSCIDENTKDIVFESAKFMRDNIRRTSRKLNLRSDSSFRYERGIDTDSQRLGLMRALTLIDKYGYGKIAKGVVDAFANPPKRDKVSVPLTKIADILGIVVPEENILNILTGLGLAPTIEDGVLTVDPPLFRDDIENANDIAEEIIRMYGYDHIEETLIGDKEQTLGGKPELLKAEDTIKDICVNAGYSETLTYSFTSEKGFDVLRLAQDDPLRKCVKLLNPLGEDTSVMRTTLVYSALNALASNALKNIKEAKLFEVSAVYLPKEAPVTELPEERDKLVVAAYGEKYDYYALKELVDKILYKFGISPIVRRSAAPWLHAGRGADLFVGKFAIGSLGEVHPDVAKALDVKQRMYVAELDVESLLRYRARGYKFVETGKYPPIERDIAVVVDEGVEAAKILECATKAAGKALREAKIFDIYRSDALGKGKKSVAVKLEFRLPDRTLTDEEAQAAMDAVLQKLAKDVGAVLR